MLASHVLEPESGVCLFPFVHFTQVSLNERVSI